jgi:hypothetical protein
MSPSGPTATLVRTNTTPSPQPTTQAVKVHPKGTLTRLAPVDGVLSKIYSGEAEKLADNLVLTPLPCGITGPPCDPNVSEGTIIRAFLLSSCQPNYDTSIDRIRQYLLGLNGASLQLVGVYEPRQDSPFRPAFGIATVGSANQAMTTLYVDVDGRLAGVASCTPFFPPSNSKILFDAPQR